MRKIPTLFVRDENDRRYVTEEVTPGCEWVMNGEGTATRKYDGTCVGLSSSGRWLARREVKRGKGAPPGFEPLEYDEATGKTVGWEPIEQSPFHKFWAEAVERQDTWEPGTYELIGPKINGNPEGRECHELVRHGCMELNDVRDYDDIRWYLDALHDLGVEGIVWHHPTGLMAKIKCRDFPAVSP